MGNVKYTYAVRLAVEDGGQVKAELVEIGASGEKALQQIEKGGKSASGGLEALTSRAKSLSGSIKLMAASALSAVSIGGLALLTKNAIDSADAIAKTADNIGISTDALQELRFAADLSGVSQERFDKALQKFTIRIGEAAAGTGEAKDAFNLLGISVLDAEGRLQSTETILNQVSDALSGIESPTERARVAYNLFGREGVAMVNLLAKGSAEMETMRQKARDLGLVLDEDLLRNAEKAQDELSILHKVISVNLNRALLDLSPIIADTSSVLSELAADAGNAYEKMKLFFSGDFKLEGQSLRSVNRDIKNLDESIGGLQKRLDSIGNQEQQAGKLGFLIDPFHVETNRLQAEIDRLEEQRKQLQDKKDKLEAEKNAKADSGDTAGAASAEGEGIALTHKVGSQNFFPRPRSFLLVVLLKINGIHYTIKRPVLGFPRSTFAFISIMNNVGSGAVVEVYEMRFEQLGALWMGSAVFEDQPILNLIRMTRPQGGETVTPVGIAGEIPNSDIVLLNGCIDSPIRYTPVLAEAYRDPFADTLNGYGALVTTSTIWFSQGNPNVKEFPGSIRRSLELLNVAPGATNNNKLAHDFAPQYNERFSARGNMGRAITLNAQEGIVLANQRTLASAAEYYWEVEFQYIEPSDQFPTVAYAYVA